MKILLTGAAGGIGSLLAKRLHENGHSLFLVDDLSGGSESNLANLKFPFELHKWDLSVSENVDQIFDQFTPDYIIHLASLTALADCQSNPDLAFQSNTRTTLLLLEKSRKFMLKRFILASTSAVYEKTNTLKHKESDAVSPQLIYPLSKKMSEDICEAYSKVYEIPITVLRLFNVYGPYQNVRRRTPPLLNYLCREYLNNRVPILHSSGEQRRDYVSVHDVVDAFDQVISMSDTLSEFEVINIASGEQASVKQIDFLVRQELGIKYLPTYREARKMWDQFDNLYDTARQLPEHIVESEVTKESLGDNSIGRAILKWSPISLTEGLKQVINEIKISQAL
jgi:UDP-glucose 4-epimerase